MLEMIEKLSVNKLFGDMTFEFLRPLKAQTAALMANTPSEFVLAWKFMIALAYSEKFEASVLKGIPRALKQSGVSTLSTDAEHMMAWQAFKEGSTQHLVDKKVILGVGKAFEALIKGAGVLTTHMDKSSEFPQTLPAKAGFLKGLTKALSCNVQTYDSPDARVLVKSAFADDLPIGVTMSAHDQAALGIVCSPVEPMLTSVGNAGDAPLQYLFLINLCTADSAPISFFEVLSDKRLDVIGQMLGLKQVPTEAEMLGWLSEGEGELALMAAFYFGVNYMVYGHAYHEHYQVMLSKATSSTQGLRAASLVNTPDGRGLSMIRLPVEGGYRLATPLINAGMLRDIHNLLKHEWNAIQPLKRMTTLIRVGGSKPQNAGSFFSNVMNMGRINAFNAYLPSQNSGARLLQKKLQTERLLYSLKADRALEISARRPSADPAWLSKRLHPRAQRALEVKVDWFVADVVRSLQSVYDYAQTNKAIEFYLLKPVTNSTVKAERDIVLGQATEESILHYARYLQKQVFEKALLTTSEKYVVTTRLVLALKCSMKEA
jgi:hypothetical protein